MLCLVWFGFSWLVGWLVWVGFFCFVFRMLAVSQVRFQFMYSNSPRENPHCGFVFSVLETEVRSIHVGKMCLIMYTFLANVLR